MVWGQLNSAHKQTNKQNKMNTYLNKQISNVYWMINLNKIIVKTKMNFFLQYLYKYTHGSLNLIGRNF